MKNTNKKQHLNINRIFNKFNQRHLLINKSIQTMPTYFLTYFSMFLITNIDSIIAGIFIDSNALKAIQILQPITLTSIAISCFFSFGIVYTLSKAYGSNKINSIKKCYKASLFLLIIALISTAIITISMTIILVNNTSIELRSSIWEYSIGYLISLTIGNISVFGTNSLIGSGKSGNLMVLSLIEGGVHVLFNYLFVGPCHMGIAGLGFSMLIANIVRSSSTVFLCLRKLEIFPLYSGPIKHKVLQIISNGIPETITSISLAVESELLNRYLNIYLPEDGLLIRSATLLMSNLSMIFINTIVRSITSYWSLTYSVKDKKGEIFLFKIGSIITTLIIGILTIFSFIYPQAYFKFLNIKYNSDYLFMARLFSISLVFEGFTYLFRNYFVMYKKRVICTIVGVATSLVLILFSFLFGEINPFYIFLSFAISRIIANVYYTFLFFGNKKKTRIPVIAYETTRDNFEKSRKVIDTIFKMEKIEKVNIKNMNEALEKFKIFLETRNDKNYRVQIGLFIEKNEIVLYMLDSNKKMFEKRIDKKESISGYNDMANFSYNYLLKMNYCSFRFVDSNIKEELEED